MFASSPGYGDWDDAAMADLDRIESQLVARQLQSPTRKQPRQPLSQNNSKAFSSRPPSQTRTTSKSAFKPPSQTGQVRRAAVAAAPAPEPVAQAQPPVRSFWDSAAITKPSSASRVKPSNSTSVSAKENVGSRTTGQTGKSALGPTIEAAAAPKHVQHSRHPSTSARPPLPPLQPSSRPAAASTSAMVPPTSRRSIASTSRLPPPRPRPIAPAIRQEIILDSEGDDDDMWVFDVPDVDFSKVVSKAISTIPVKGPMKPTSQKAKPRISTAVIPDSDGDTSLTMLPPPLPSLKPSRPPSAALRRSTAPLVATADESFDSPVVVSKKRAGKRKAIVVDSSSPPVIGPSRTRTVTTESALEPGTQKKVLKRIRRCRVEDDEDEEERSEQQQDGNFSEPEPMVNERRKRRTSTGKREAKAKPAPKIKEAAITTTKKKEKKLTEYEVAHSKMFDFEAVNSSAEETEASSEDYDSEDSDDRNFVASECGDFDSPGIARFYHESLLSQAPGFFRSPARPGAFKMSRGVYHVAPVTPDSPDQWSYDSFCVPDDAEISYDTSSQA